MLHNSFLLSVLIGCSLASFIAPHYVGYGYYQTGPQNPDGSGVNPPGVSPNFGTGTGTIDGNGNGNGITGTTARPIRIVRVGPNGRLIVTVSEYY